MKNLIKAEFFKLRKSTAYKALLMVYFIMEAVIQMNNVSNSVVYPKYNPAYTGVEFLLLGEHQTVLLYFVVVFLFTAFYVNGDFTAHTFYSSLLCGIPRKNAFWAKAISLFIGMVPLMLVYFLTGTVLWSIHSGFGMNFGTEAVFLIAKAFAIQIGMSIILASHAVLFAVIAKGKTSTFLLCFGTLYVAGVLRGNIENIIPIPAISKILLFLLSLSALNYGTLLASILLKLLAARAIFERFDLK